MIIVIVITRTNKYIKLQSAILSDMKGGSHKHCSIIV